MTKADFLNGKKFKTKTSNDVFCLSVFCLNKVKNNLEEYYCSIYDVNDDGFISFVIMFDKILEDKILFKNLELI